MRIPFAATAATLRIMSKNPRDLRPPSGAKPLRTLALFHMSLPNLCLLIQREDDARLMPNSLSLLTLIEARRKVVHATFHIGPKNNS